MISFVTHVRQNGLVENDIYMTRGDDGYISLPIYETDGSDNEILSERISGLRRKSHNAAGRDKLGYIYQSGPNCIGGMVP